MCFVCVFSNSNMEFVLKSTFILVFIWSNRTPCNATCNNSTKKRFKRTLDKNPHKYCCVSHLINREHRPFRWFILGLIKRFIFCKIYFYPTIRFRAHRCGLISCHCCPLLIPSSLCSVYYLMPVLTRCPQDDITKTAALSMHNRCYYSE